MKTVTFLVRRPDLTREAFVEYWFETHVPLARRLNGLRKYTTSVALDPDAPFDGIAELHFDTEADLFAVLGPESGSDAIEDVPNFIESMTRHLVTETVQLSGESDDNTIRYVAVLHRPKTLTHEAFSERWGDHINLVHDLPGLVRYVTGTPLHPEVDGFDGLLELYFEDQNALTAALGANLQYETIPALEASARAFVDHSTFLITKEAVQKARA